MTLFVQAEKLAEFEYLFKTPPMLNHTSSHFILTDRKSGEILLINRQCLKEDKRFGKIGEGPGEFLQFVVNVETGKDQILVDSFGRLSHFDTQGNFLREHRHEMGFRIMALVGKNMVIAQLIRSKNAMVGLEKIILCDPDYKELKTFSSLERTLSMDKHELLRPRVWSGSNGTICFVSDQNGTGDISLYNEAGERVGQVDYDFPIIPVSSETKAAMKKEFIETMARSRMPKGYLEKLQVIVPDVFPPFNNVLIDHDKLLVYLSSNDMKAALPVVCFDLTGKYMGKLKVAKGESGQPYQGYFFSIRENEENETWELFRYAIPKPEL